MNTGIIDIENGFLASSLTAFKVLADTTYLDASYNAYLEPVVIPEYDALDTSHLLITTGNGKWTEANLNNATYKHFYVQAGDYSSLGWLDITADGAVDDRRTISLYDSGDPTDETHPASLAEADQADVKFLLVNASYWTIDRMSFLSIGEFEEPWWMSAGASYNVYNRIHVKDYYYGPRINHQSNYNTIQNSYINHMSHAGRLSDNVGIALTTGGQGEGTEILGTKIINNDIRNAGDGIQLVIATGIYDVNYAGTIIDSNRIWVDGDVFTNGDYGTTSTYDPTGEYQIAENAMDFKAGSQDALNPVIVSNNVMWGFQEGDGTAGGSQSAGRGTTMPTHYDALNIHWQRNVFCDSMTGTSFTGRDPLDLWSQTDCEFTDNIFYHMCYINPTSRQEYINFAYYANNLKFNNNSFIDINAGTNNGYYMRFETSGGTCEFNNNLFIDTTGYTSTSTNQNVVVDGNYYYNTITHMPATGSETTQTAASNMADFYFEYERFTTTPKNKTLTNALSTATSPHYGVAGSDLE